MASSGWPKLGSSLAVSYMTQDLFETKDESSNAVESEIVGELAGEDVAFVLTLDESLESSSLNSWTMPGKDSSCEMLAFIAA